MSILNNSSSKNPLSSSLNSEKIVLKCDGMSGFDPTFPRELKGKINPLDYKYILYKLNHSIFVFKANLIRHIITNFITISIFFVILTLTVIHIMTSKTNLIFSALGFIGLFGSIAGVIRENKKIMSNIEETALELSDRYKDINLSFNIELKSKNEPNSFGRMVMTAANYNFVIYLKDQPFNNNDISIHIGTPLIN